MSGPWLCLQEFPVWWETYLQLTEPAVVTLCGQRPCRRDEGVGSWDGRQSKGAHYNERSQTSELQSGKITNVCHLKPLSSWQFIIAATGN